MPRLVINISDGEYKDFKKLKEYGFGTTFNGLVERIANGTPLPKGHGRLIDVSKIVYEKECEYLTDGSCTTKEIPNIEATPTIIEADEGDDE